MRAEINDRPRPRYPRNAMTDERGQLKDWATHEEVLAMVMAKYGLTKEEAEKQLKKFDSECPWAVDDKPPQ